MSDTLPLGIDIGATRVRIVCAELSGTTARLRGVVARDVPCVHEGQGDADAPIASLILEAWDQLHAAEQRCVLSLGAPQAQLRPAILKAAEGGRHRAAYALARRGPDYPVEDAVVRWHAIERARDLYALGITRSAVLLRRLECLASTPLRVTAVDHDALALQRVLPHYDAVLDIGHASTRLHQFCGAIPVTTCLQGGSAQMTRQIQDDLGIDERSAEIRKRTYGINGAGEAALDRFIADVATAIDAARRRSERLRRVGMVGNGARVAQLPMQLQRRCGCLFELAVPDILTSVAEPASAADYALAAGLSIWSATA